MVRPVAKLQEISQPAVVATHLPVSEKPQKWHGAKIKPTIGVLVLGTLLWFMPVPAGLDIKAWHLFAIFATTIAAVIVRPLPMGAVAVIAMGVAVLTKTLTLTQTLSTFSSSVVWLIVMAFLIARGFIKTGLGERMAYFFISSFGKSTLGLSYGLTITEFLLSPAIPSNTARGAGVIFPIVRSLADGYGSKPSDRSSKKIGAYLTTVAFHVNVVTSAIFLTAMASNPLVASLASGSGIVIDWFTWFKLASVPGIISLAFLPYFIYKISPPELKETPDAPARAQEALREKGPFSLHEKIMSGTFVSLLTLWVLGDYIGIDATTTALLGFGALLFTGVLTWDDVVNEKGAWDTLLWFAALLMMATMLTKFGMMDWFAGQMNGVVAGLSWEITLVVMGLVFFYIHYMFASVTAHVTSLFGAFLVVLLALGAPPMMAAMSLAVLSCLSASLTHYGTGSAPVLYGAGFVTVKEWWRVGGLVGLYNLLIWGVPGGIWWKILGLW